MDGLDFFLVFLVLSLMAAFFWLLWLYIFTYRQLVSSNRDRDRLIRRIGQYHSIALTTPSDTLPPLPPEATVPPAFRMKRPTPPAGFRPSKG